MSTLTGRTVATTYKDLLQISNQNSGIDGQYRYIEDGEGTISVLGLSTDGIQINGHVQPATTETYDLGSGLKRFRDLYLSGNSIHLGQTVFTTDDVQAVKDVQTTSLPVSSIAELASTSVQPGDPISFSTLINRPVTLAGYGITDSTSLTLHGELSGRVDVVETDISNQNTVISNINNEIAALEDFADEVDNTIEQTIIPSLTTLSGASGTWDTATQPDTDVQFNDLTVTGHIAGPAEMRIDPAAVGNNTGKVVIAGDLQVDGVTTTVNSTTMTVSGKTITLAEGATDPSMTDQSGIHVDHVDVNILYDSTTDTWRTNRDLVVQDKLTAATLSATGDIMVDGTVDAAGDLKVQGDSVVTQSDVGIAPNQIPQNKDLGSLAYMDQLNTDELQVNELYLKQMVVDKKEITGATNIFVYDTRKDSDAGAWRDRVKHTSWYNEPLNTSTRGPRRDFPSVAVFVINNEGGSYARSCTIYDGDDPELSMWMTFYVATANYAQGGYMLGGSLGAADDSGAGRSGRAVVAKNGQFWYGRTGSYNSTNAYGALNWVNFLTDNGGSIRPHAGQTETNGQIYTSAEYTGNIAARNTPILNELYPHKGNYRQHKYWRDGDGNYIPSNNVVDLDITVFPDAPIDPDTKLPVPTVAVATYSGLAILRDDHTILAVQHSGSYGSSMRVKIDTDRREVVVGHNGPSSGQCIEVFDIDRLQDSGSAKRVGPIHGSVHNNPTNFITTNARWYAHSNSTTFHVNFRDAAGLYDLPSFGSATTLEKQDDTIYFGSYYLAKIHENTTQPSHGMLNITRESFNTGWMVGDTRANVMCDLQTGTIGQQEGVNIIQNNSFASTTEPWVYVQPTDNGWYYDEPNNIMRFTQASDSSVGLLYQDVDVLANHVYRLTGQPTNNNVRYKVISLQDDGTVAPGANVLLDSNVTVTGATEQIFRPSTNRVRVQLEASSSASTVDGVEVHLISNMVQPELAWNGSRGGTATGSLGAWDGTIRIEGNSGGLDWSGAMCTLTNLEVGKQYIATARAGNVLTPAGGGASNWHMGRTTNDQGAHSDLVWAAENIDDIFSYRVVNSDRFEDSETQRLVFTARYTTEYIFIQANNTSSGDGSVNPSFILESFDVRETIEDRCPRVSNPRDGGRGFSLHGQLQRTPVAPGAELIGYSGFGEHNFLSQPYNTSYNFTDEICVMGWFKSDVETPTAQGHLLNIFEDSSETGNSHHSYIRVLVDSNPRIYFQVLGTSSSGNADTIWHGQSIGSEFGFTLPTTWTHYCATRDKIGRLHMYINGIDVTHDPKTSYIHNGDTTLPVWGPTAVAYMGNSPHSGGEREYSGHSPFLGSMAMWRIGRHAATPKQVEVIYNQEKRMFQPGAQVALTKFEGDPYKSYVTITDMCLDQDTNQLHVVTGLGRSSFEDLIRVDQNDITSNRVHASNGLLIEG